MTGAHMWKSWFLSPKSVQAGPSSFPVITVLRRKFIYTWALFIMFSGYILHSWIFVPRIKKIKSNAIRKPKKRWAMHVTICVWQKKCGDSVRKRNWAQFLSRFGCHSHGYIPSWSTNTEILQNCTLSLIVMELSFFLIIPQILLIYSFSVAIIIPMFLEAILNTWD